MENKLSIFSVLFLLLLSSCTDRNKDVAIDLDAMGPKGCSIKKLNDCTHSEFEKCKLDRPDCETTDPFLQDK
ncbi:MAG: hypothetical protein KAG61_14205 [Bacteriovoracaceae bacterium]|nr:hypothetical protein [Bacteriovoracaceae bacterium]